MPFLKLRSVTLELGIIHLFFFSALQGVKLMQPNYWFCPSYKCFIINSIYFGIIDCTYFGSLVARYHRDSSVRNENLGEKGFVVAFFFFIWIGLISVVRRSKINQSRYLLHCSYNFTALCFSDSEVQCSFYS